MNLFREFTCTCLFLPLLISKCVCKELYSFRNLLHCLLGLCPGQIRESRVCTHFFAQTLGTNMYCPICKHDHKVLTCDKIALGYANKYLTGALRPPTWLDDMSDQRPKVQSIPMKSFDAKVLRLSKEVMKLLPKEVTTWTGSDYSSFKFIISVKLAELLPQLQADSASAEAKALAGFIDLCERTPFSPLRKGFRDLLSQVCFRFLFLS